MGVAALAFVVAVEEAGAAAAMASERDSCEDLFTLRTDLVTNEPPS